MLTGNAPVGNLVQGTGKKTMGKDYPGKALGLAHREIFRFVAAPDQNRPV